ncbi:MAG TPA: IS110 family transposase [Solirubrobacterales bacterium]|jgi:transposase|nr:IS110 family transposase [Solirubrobacterales bacterium]
MLHAGLDLSRKRLDVCLLSDQGELVEELAAFPDSAGLKKLAERVEAAGQPVRAVIESMTGARFVHDTLERLGWEVLIADAQKVKGLAPLAVKTDRIDARVLAVLSQRDLVPAIWLPDPRVRRERELARFRLHLVKHRSQLKNRIHSALISFGRPCPVTDLFGVAGREHLARLDLPEPWRGNIDASLALLDQLEGQIDEADGKLRQSGADHPYVPLLLTVPGVGWVLAFTIAAEIGEISRFPSATKLTGYTGLCPRVLQSGDSDRRGPLSKHGPRYLRWALLEATMHALRHPAYAERYQRTKRRLGKQRGAKVAQVDIARRLAVAIWHMLTRNEEFAPRGAAFRLAA